MKISVNWMQQFAGEAKLMPNGIDELTDKIGAQLGAVDEVNDLGQKYQGIVVAKVIKCDKHPNADKLSLCTIDDGGNTLGVNRDENGHIQVVCGAPNVRSGLLVAWLPPGTTVPSSFGKEPFVLDAREIRGVVSNGMLASAHELGMSDDHNGIAEIEADARPGDDFAKVYGLDDYVIDIENKMFTHRPDCFGQLGVAREIAGIQGQAFKSPDWYVNASSIVSGSSNAIQGYDVDNQIPDLCPRYMMVAIEGVSIAPSPMWLQTYLNRVGVRPINNIVDMTNYMMLLTGQPLHAFDYDKVAINNRADIIVRRPNAGEKLTLLDGKTIEPRSEAILICNPNGPIALGGVMGGNNSEIDENTTRIIIECANFDMYNIRKTAMEHGLFTDAVTRFNKGQSSWQCPPIIRKAVAMTQELSPGAQPVGTPIDMHQPKQQNQPITITAGFVNERLGLTLSAQDMASLLINVEFSVTVEDDRLTLTAPFWRTDIEILEDVIEEVGRLYGYDKLPLDAPRRDITPVGKNNVLQLKQNIRDILAKTGANEVLTYSFVHGNLYDKVGQNKELAYQLSNALSPDLQYYRMSLMPSLLEKVHPNVKMGYEDFAIFEIGKAHIKGLNDDEGLPKELERLAFVCAADGKTVRSKTGSAYYLAKKYVTELLRGINLSGDLMFEPLLGGDEDQATTYYETNRAATIKAGDDVIGRIGEFSEPVRRNLKLPEFCAGFELDLEPIRKKTAAHSRYRPLPKFPKVQQDITLKVASSLPYDRLYKFLSGQLLNTENTHASLEPIDIYQSKEDLSTKHLTFRFTIAHYQKTLRSEEVNLMLDEAAAAAHKELGAERV